MPRKSKPPAAYGDDLFSIPLQSTVNVGLSRQSWPAQERFPVNRPRVYVGDVVGDDLRGSDKPLLIAGYSSIAELIDLVADWRRERGAKQGTVRVLLGSEPFRSQRLHFASQVEEFTTDVREFWLEQSI